MGSWAYNVWNVAFSPEKVTKSQCSAQQVWGELLPPISLHPNTEMFLLHIFRNAGYTPSKNWVAVEMWVSSSCGSASACLFWVQQQWLVGVQTISESLWWHFQPCHYHIITSALLPAAGTAKILMLCNPLKLSLFVLQQKEECWQTWAGTADLCAWAELSRAIPSQDQF